MKFRDKGHAEWVIRNIRAQYKIPKNVVTLSSVKEWMKKMKATDFKIRMMEEAMEYAQS